MNDMRKTSPLEITITDAGWRRVPRLASRLEQAAQVTLQNLPKAMRFPVTFSLLLTSDAKIRQLNHDFRGMKRPTNVLSFPQYEPSKLTKLGKGKGPAHMGDVAIAYQYIVAEAKKDHKILINHTIHLMIHGLLHLFGYDHGLNVEAVRMERLEQKIMKDLGLPDPYAAATPAKRKRSA